MYKIIIPSKKIHNDCIQTLIHWICLRAAVAGLVTYIIVLLLYAVTLKYR